MNEEKYERTLDCKEVVSTDICYRYYLKNQTKFPGEDIDKHGAFYEVDSTEHKNAQKTGFLKIFDDLGQDQMAAVNIFSNIRKFEYITTTEVFEISR
jgi:hypothetical protein